MPERKRSGGSTMCLFQRVFFSAEYSQWFTRCLLLAEAIICLSIIAKIKYTEIDWKTYMQQIKQVINGERRYSNIKGNTGPLVYPAMHVYIYSILYSLTQSGENILRAQYIFAGVYLVALAIVFKVYQTARAPGYLFFLLCLSKRLHSIFLLRLFNDAFVSMFLFLTILLYQQRRFYLASVIFSMGLGTKMSLLLVSPAVALVNLLAIGYSQSVTQFLIIMQVQILLAYPFLGSYWLDYFTAAFNFSRQFLFQWTVNWRFLSQSVFESKLTAVGLLIANALILLFFLKTRWLRVFKIPSTLEILKLIMFDPMAKEGRMSQKQEEAALIIKSQFPIFVPTIFLTCNVIGMLCARSLHYQFFAWTCWGTPFLLWRARLPPIVLILLWLAQEWAWNVYPSTSASSIVVLVSLLVQVVSVWFGTRNDFIESNKISSERSKERKSLKQA